MEKRQLDGAGDQAAKKARIEGGWTCAQCGNMNFADRTTCNLRKCGAQRPSGPSGGSLAQGGWTCTACGNQNFADRTVCNMRKCNAPRPDIALMAMKHAFRPPIAQAPLAFPRPARDGDWQCLQCGNMNFADRHICNMRSCAAPRPSQDSQVSYAASSSLIPSYSPTRSPMIPSKGDEWTCGSCGNVNFGDRLFCNMRKCGASRDATNGEEGLMQQKGSGTSEGLPERVSNWTCAQCGNENFGDRAFCNMRRCGAVRQLQDWICSCGNRNFADRMVCNLRKCGLLRADVHPKAAQTLVAKGKGKGR